MSSNQPTLVLESGRAERQYWRVLWRYRELFFFLAWRDILVRYKQTVLGIVWDLGRSSITMLAIDWKPQAASVVSGNFAQGKNIREVKVFS